MAVTVTDVLAGPFFPNSSTTAFPFDFKVPSASELLVFSLSGGVIASVSSGLYSVAVASDGEGGMVNFTSAPSASLGELYIKVDPDFSQLATFSNSGFLPASLNPVLDRMAMKDLLLLHEVRRCSQWPETVEAVPFGDISEGQVLALVAGELVGIDNLGGSTAAAQAAAAAALVSQGAAEDAADLADASRVSADTSAGNAADSAAAALAAVADAEDARDDAQVAAAAAALAANRIYANTAAGVAAVADQEYFWVQNGDGDLQLYRDNAGSPVAEAFVMPSVATVEAAGSAYLRFASPFLQTVADDYMRSIVYDVAIEGGDDKIDGRYILNIESLNLGGGNGRVTFKIRDIILGIDVCIWQKIDTQANLAARTSETILLTQGALAGYTGTTATLRINWAGVTNWAVGLTGYTTAAQAGIRGDRVVTPSEIRQRFKAGAEPRIRLTVGPGTVTATHFNSFAAAIQSLYIPGVSVTRSTYPLSDICTFSNQVLIECVADGYVESIAATTIGLVDQSTVVLPPFITLRGRGRTDTRLYMNAGTNGAPVLEAPFPFRIEEMMVESEGKGYAVHIDNVNDRARRSTVGPAVLRYSMMSIFYKATLKGGAAQFTWTIGCGISNKQSICLYSSRVIGGAALPQLGIHTSPSTTDGGEVEIFDTYFNDALVAGSAVQLIKSNAMTAQHHFNMKGTTAGTITVGNTAGGASGFTLDGRLDTVTNYAGGIDV